MSDVFVSYKAEDRKRVRPLVEALEAEGYTVWWDEQIGGGAAWRHSIEAELNAAKCVLVAWSKRSVGAEGTFVQDEATRAQQRHVYVPVTIDKVTLPLGFGENQALPLNGWRGNRSDPRFQAVLESVRRLAGESAASSPVRPAAAIDRRTALIGGGVAAAAAVAGAGAWTLFGTGPAKAAGSIAVLPFANLSGNPEQNYFSDGMAEELRSALGRVAGLEVVGRTSSEAVRDEDAQSAAKKLGVANILTGSVRQSPSTIRVSAQLIDGTDGVERWSQNYDRQPGDSIKIQTDIAENVARALSITLGAAGLQAIAAGGTQNAEAQRLLFKAIEMTRQGGDEAQAIRNAIDLSEAAIRLDPNYADAYAHKALYTNWYSSTFATSIDELNRTRVVASRLASKAIEIAPDLPSAHRAIADIYRVQLNVRPAIREYRKTLDLEPGNAEVMADLSMLLAALGKTGEPLSLAARAIDADPLNPITYMSMVVVLNAAGRIDDALAYAQDIERNKPYVFNFPEMVGYLLVLKGRFADARSYFEQGSPESYNRIVLEGTVHARTGQNRRAAESIKSLRDIYGDAASFQLAQVYAQLGDKNAAFAALNRAFEIKDAGLLRVKTDPLIAPLRSDPRYAALLRRLDYPTF